MIFQGSNFGKHLQENFFAINDRDLPSANKNKEKRRHIEISDDDDSDDFISKPKKKYKSSQLDEIRDRIEEINEQLKCVCKISKTTKVPPGLYSLLNDAFQCCICRCVPIKPPAIYSRCCKKILGCQHCVDRWYRNNGLENSCPICHSVRAYTETTQIKGLDDFLNGVRPLLEDEGLDATDRLTQLIVGEFTY